MDKAAKLAPFIRNRHQLFNFRLNAKHLSCFSYLNRDYCSNTYDQKYRNVPVRSNKYFSKCQPTGLNLFQCRYYSDLPNHVKVTLPALSPTMEMGSIVSWEKKEGDHVQEGDLLAEIETDKATMGLEATEEGYVAKIYIPAGTKNIPLGSLLAIMVEEEDSVAKFSNVKLEEVQTLSPAPKSPSAAAPLPPATTTSTPVSPIPSVAASSPPPSSTTDRLRASPYAKLVAREKGVDISQVPTASGADGRIVSADVEQFAASGVAAPTAGVVSAATVTTVGQEFVDIQLSNVRSVIAKRLTQAKQSIPHYYLTVDIVMDKVVKLRKNLNKNLESRQLKLSVNDFVIKAAAVSLLRVPEVNSSWHDTYIRQYSHADISVAVASDRGLITPIVFSADSKGLLAINADVLSLAAKAKSGKLKPEEFQGGTFTISNLGMFGIKSFSAIINPPQSCILAVGGAEQRVVPDFDDGYKTVSVMSCTLCCDHRVVDGAIGSRWLAEFKQCLEDPFNMLL